MICNRKLQRFVKKGESSRSRDDRKEKPEPNPRDEENYHNRPQSTIGEIKTIIRGPSIGGSFRSFKKL